MMVPLRCAIVEDEPEARENLLAYLEGVPDLAVVGFAADGLAAVELIDSTQPDLVLLDIQIPELSGIDVLRRITHRPEVVFTTAHASHAITAFELGALDYIVKPFGRERVLRAVRRVIARTRPATEPRIGTHASTGRFVESSGADSRAGSDDDAAGGGTVESAVDRALAASTTRPLERLYARVGNRIVPIPTHQILRIEAQADYAEVHSERGAFLIHVPLKELEALLDPARFERVHRSHIVNLDAVTALSPADDRRLTIRLRDGSTVIASRSCSERLRQRVR